MRWQTYTHVPDGYRFQYPADYQICAVEEGVELIPEARYFDNPDTDHCTLLYQANPISVLFSVDDTVFQNFNARNYPDSFVDYQEESLDIANYPATRISGMEVETGVTFQVVRIEHDGSYLILKARGEENISILKAITGTVRFLSDGI